MNRRHFLAVAAAFPVGCAMNRHDNITAAPVRAPALGQSWQYAKHDLFTRTQLDIQIEHVVAVGRTIDIESHSQGGKVEPASHSSWGMKWLHKYVDRPKPTTLPSEVQSPWGMILVDPHWNQVQVYETPIPLWPAQLEPGWHDHFTTRYKTAESDSGMRWEQTMKAEDWETISVPAGSFKTLRYINHINYRDSDSSRADAMRRETLWLAPEVGRWVAREATGSYYVDDSAVDQPYSESSYRWELLSWT